MVLPLLIGMAAIGFAGVTCGTVVVTFAVMMESMMAVMTFVMFAAALTLAMVLALGVVGLWCCCRHRRRRRHRHRRWDNDSLVPDDGSWESRVVSTTSRARDIMAQVVPLSTLEVLLPPTQPSSPLWWEEHTEDHPAIHHHPTDDNNAMSLPPPMNPYFQPQGLETAGAATHAEGEEDVIAVVPYHDGKNYDYSDMVTFRVALVLSVLMYLMFLASTCFPPTTRKKQSDPYDLRYSPACSVHSQGKPTSTCGVVSSLDDSFLYAYDSVWYGLDWMSELIKETFVNDYSTILLGVHSLV